MILHHFDLQQKDNYINIQNMKLGQIAVTESGKILLMRVNGNCFVVLAGGKLSGDTFGPDANMKVRILPPGSVVSITIEG